MDTYLGAEFDETDKGNDCIPSISYTDHTESVLIIKIAELHEIIFNGLKMPVMWYVLASSLAPKEAVDINVCVSIASFPLTGEKAWEVRVKTAWEARGSD